MADKPRDFLSIQVVTLNSNITLLAIAKDGTAWAADTGYYSGVLAVEGLQWRQVAEIPDTPRRSIF